MTWTRLRDVLCHRAVVVTAVLLLAWGAFSLWSSWTGAQKLTTTELANAKNGRVHVEVTLNFSPEAFHMMLFQSIGRLIEVKAETAYLMDVRVEDARTLARQYWVKDIKPWPGR
jgi:hypothetical protein